MSKEIASIPLSSIERVQIYINTSEKKLAEVKAETGADYLINGGLYDMGKFKPNCHLKADGYVYAQDQYTYWGYGWDAGPDISMQLIPNNNRKNYISCVELIRNSTPNKKPTYTASQGGKRGRTAIGIDGVKLCLYVSSDGSSDAKTPEQLRDELASLGWDSAVMLDSGGSSQCDFNGKRIVSSRIVQNLILVYLKKGEKKPVSKTYTVCLDPGHGPGTVNGSPDGTYKEHEFCWDMYTRIKPLLEKQGIKVVGTRGQNEKPSLLNRCKVSDNAKADLLVSLHSDASKSVDSNGWSSASGLHVITSMGPLIEKRNVAANALLNQFKVAGVAIRGSGLSHNISLVVLAKSAAPACLIEFGFHTNQSDVAKLKDSAYRDKLAITTAKGVCDYFGVAYQNVTPPQPVMTDRQRVQERFGFNNETMDYLQGYKYNTELLKKLAEGK